MQGQFLQQTLKNRLEALEASGDSERLRLALMGAEIAVFDWTIADDRIEWDGAATVLKHHPEPQKLESGQAFRTWLGPAARGRLLAFVDEPSPADPTFTVEFEALSRTARFSSPLGVYDFQKRSSVIGVSAAGAKRLGAIASTNWRV